MWSMRFNWSSMCMKWSTAPLQISSGLVPQPPSPTPNLPPTKNDWDTVFCPLFDEYYNPPPRAISLVPETVAAPRAVDPASSPSSRYSSSEETTLQRFIPSNFHHLNNSGHAIWCYFDANDNPVPLVGNGVVEIYYLKGRIMVLKDLQHSFRNSDACYHDPERDTASDQSVRTYFEEVGFLPEVVSEKRGFFQECIFQVIRKKFEFKIRTREGEFTNFNEHILAIPTRYWNDRSDNLTLILVGLRVLRDNFAYKEYDMRLMLAPRSPKALHEKALLKLHGMRKLPGSPSFGGTLF
nr:hypothetical protein [Tanacetum cinerariifolium]